MNQKNWAVLAGAGVIVTVVGFSVSLLSSSPSGQISNQGADTSPVKKVGIVKQSVLASEVTVFRSPSCSCCESWIDHLETTGFQVKDTMTEDLAAIKQQQGIPDELAACHTAIIGDYVIEGHVPATDIQRLLANQPEAVAGLALPGMPIGSPGMESGDYVESYTVFTFAKDGSSTAFAQYP